jgi:hypothetical protein
LRFAGTSRARATLARRRVRVGEARIVVVGEFEKGRWWIDKYNEWKLGRKKETALVVKLIE